jgi:uncharacterized phiE125 gp8 family phage protein
MHPRRTTTPAEPLTLAEALTHLRETGDGGANDEYIEVIITAAREACEARTERTLTTTGWFLQLDGFPSVTSDNPNAAIYLYQPPIIAVQSVQYLNASGTLTTIDPADYVLDAASAPGRLVPAPGKVWPAVQDGAINSVRVAYTAGYGAAADVPKPLRQWMLLAIGDMYENRNGSTERPSIPHDFADNLLNPYRMLGV